MAERTLFESPGKNPATFRRFRLLCPLPVCAEFFAMRYFLDLYEEPHTAGRECLVVHLPWQTKENGRTLTHAGRGVIRGLLFTGFHVHVPSISDLLFLRLARQGDAELLAGPHTSIPWKDRRFSRGDYSSEVFYG